MDPTRLNKATCGGRGQDPNAMGNWNLFALKPRRVIKYELAVIENRVAAQAQFSLFKKQVKEVFKSERLRGGYVRIQARVAQ